MRENNLSDFIFHKTDIIEANVSLGDNRGRDWIQIKLFFLSIKTGRAWNPNPVEVSLQGLTWFPWGKSSKSKNITVQWLIQEEKVDIDDEKRA